MFSRAGETACPDTTGLGHSSPLAAFLSLGVLSERMHRRYQEGLPAATALTRFLVTTPPGCKLLQAKGCIFYCLLQAPSAVPTTQQTLGKCWLNYDRCGPTPAGDPEGLIALITRLCSSYFSHPLLLSTFPICHASAPGSPEVGKIQAPSTAFPFPVNTCTPWCWLKLGTPEPFKTKAGPSPY